MAAWASRLNFVHYTPLGALLRPLGVGSMPQEIINSHRYLFMRVRRCGCPSLVALPSSIEDWLLVNQLHM